MDHVLTQVEIDKAFRVGPDLPSPDSESNTQTYDFRRTDRIAKDQLRAIHLLHDRFARSLAASLSAYLRSYVIVNLISVEQLSFRDFAEGLPSPTSLIGLSMKPYNGSSLLEINWTLVFPIIEMLLGGSGKAPTRITRELTEIEQSILEGLIAVILNDLRSAWLPVTAIEFALESQATEPQLLQILTQEEAVVSISIEVRIGETSGLMSLCIPSIIMKMLRQKFDQDHTVRKTQASEDDQARVLHLIRNASIDLDARLRGPTVGFPMLLDLKAGDVLVFDYPVDRPLDLIVNGAAKFRGGIIAVGKKRAMQIQQTPQDL
jgi:flagellar motor switch protein FliM